MAWLFIRVDSYSQQPPMGIFLPAFGASACRGSMEKEWRGEGEREEGEKRSGDVPPNESSSYARPEIWKPLRARRQI